MTNTLLKKIVATLLIATAVTTAFATPHTTGAYIEGGIGATYSDIEYNGKNYDTGYSTLGLNAIAGFKISRYIAAEAGIIYYGHSLYNANGTVRFILPIEVGPANANLFAKLGVGQLFSSNTSGSETVAVAGIGASYSITPKTDATAQIQTISDGFVDVGLATIGLTYYIV